MIAPAFTTRSAESARNDNSGVVAAIELMPLLIASASLAVSWMLGMCGGPLTDDSRHAVARSAMPSVIGSLIYFIV
jgi:hypothetical protein